MYWLLCASTVWKTGAASAKRVKLTDPPVAAALAGADAGAVDGPALAPAEAGACVAGVPAQAANKREHATATLSRFLGISAPLLHAPAAAVSGVAHQVRGPSLMER